MNKKREALRHGLRSFIEDTSRELADLEGRDLQPPPVAPAPQDGQASGNGVKNESVPDPAAAGASAPSAVGGSGAVGPPLAPAPVPLLPAPGPGSQERASGLHTVPVPPAAAPAVSRPPASVRRRIRRRPAPDVNADGVNPDQVHARKGVCFAYFLNPACWRIPEAYCNNALQVCITRECPVYHLHKDALEARFARKFRHFW